MDEELADREKKRQQLQDNFEKAKQDSIKAINVKHDILDEENAINEKLRLEEEAKEKEE